LPTAHNNTTSRSQDSVGSRRLDRIRPGHCGLVCEVEAGDAEVDQLKSMGVCLGREVMLIRAGDPLILKVMGTRIGLSARLAARVRVSPCHGDAFGER
jgi:Fe2+ transport system protein FeoA